MFYIAGLPGSPGADGVVGQPGLNGSTGATGLLSFPTKQNTLQPHYNPVVHSTNSVITRLRLGSHCLSWLPLSVYETLVITLFCYNTDFLWTQKSVL